MSKTLTKWLVSYCSSTLNTLLTLLVSFTLLFYICCTDFIWNNRENRNWPVLHYQKCKTGLSICRMINDSWYIVPWCHVLPFACICSGYQVHLKPLPFSLYWGKAYKTSESCRLDTRPRVVAWPRALSLPTVKKFQGFQKECQQLLLFSKHLLFLTLPAGKASSGIYIWAT